MPSPTSDASPMESDGASVSLSPSSATPTPVHPSVPPSEDNDPSEDSSRLASIARYDSLRPTALVCSHPLLDSSAVERSNGADAAHPLASPGTGGAGAVSLGAVAGSRGVALFRVDRPHAPLLVLSLASQSQSSLSSDPSSSSGMGRTDPDWVSALCFQPAPPRLFSAPYSSSSYYSTPPPPFFYLAAARGAGILVWDVSGHSLSPLWGRLTTAATPDKKVHHSSDDDAATITSLTWLGGGVGSSSGGTGGGDMLAASTATSACLWDMRAPPTSRAASKPALRFATVHPRGRGGSSHSSFSPYLQIACQGATGGARCALLDRAGTLRIYDLRHVGSSSTSSEPLLAFQAFRNAGAGLAAGPPSSTTGVETWLASGTDSPHIDDSAVVRVFEVGGSGDGRPGTSGIGGGGDHDSLLPAVDPAVDGSAIGTSTTASHASSSPPPWRVVAQCPVRQLACARMCPVSLSSGGAGGGDAAFATVAFDPPVGGAMTNDTLPWRAELWRLSASAGTGIDHEDDNDNDNRTPSVMFGLERVLSFRGGPDADRQRVPPTLGRGSSGTGASSSGTFRYGSLCAAELGVVSSSPSEALQRGGHPDDDHHRPASSQLLLCSLTDSGCVVTHAFPETANWGGSAPDHERGMRRRASGSAPPSAALRFFPRDNEYSPLPDAASGWALGSSRDPTAAAVVAEANKAQALTAEVEPREDLVGSSFAGTAPLPTRDVSGPPQLPFDMDFPSLSRATEAAPIGRGLGLLPGNTILPSLANIGPGCERSVEDARQAAQLMERIDTARIPCPRLCGASFGPGVGGLPVFHNGDVRKMWRWWDKANSVRPAATTSQLLSIEGMHLEGDGLHPLRDFPRTLRDLTVMTSSAKEAQWGSQDNSDASSSGLPDVGPSFFEEGSDASSDSDDVDSEDPADKGGLYDNYFGGSRLPLVEGSPASRDVSDSLSHDKQLSDHFGPASDVLSPFVSLSYHYENLALNGQCVGLAMGWKLGSIAFPPEELGNPDPTTSSFFKQDPHPARKRTDLPKYRFLVPTVQQPYRIPKVSSDPMLPNLLALPKPTASREGDGDRGVHGGEYGVRPNMQESMVFLRKLFTHHHEPSLFSPPDGPMLPNSRSDPSVSKTVSVTQHNTTTSSALKGPSNGNDHPSPIGLYTLRAIDPLRHETLEELKMMEENCLHNSQVCLAIDASGKGATWELLSKAVGSRRRDFGTSFDSPSAGGRGALGTKLVERLLRFYEVQGDVQMLATMVCVLRHRSASNRSNVKSWSILPSNQSLKFDLYIARYADLLFSWGLLTTRTELNKHLLSVAARKASSSASMVVAEASREGVAASTLALAFACPRCSKETVAPGTNYCRTCHDYAFRCIVCDHAIRGLFASCELCGHGGHLEHLQQWFATHDVCPTGCGCRCAAVGRGGLGGGGVAAAPAAPVTTSRPPPESVATAAANAPVLEPAAMGAGLLPLAASRRLVEV